MSPSWFSFLDKSRNSFLSITVFQIVHHDFATFVKGIADAHFQLLVVKAFPEGNHSSRFRSNRYTNGLDFSLQVARGRDKSG